MAIENPNSQSRALTVQDFRAKIESVPVQRELKKALPPHVPMDRFLRVVVSAVSANPYLLTLDQTSLFQACVAAAQLGLYTDGFLGEAYLVPFKGRVQMIPGYRGLMKLARQTGGIESIDSGLIHETDIVEWEEGDESKFRVIPKSWNDRGEIAGAFAIVKFKDGGVQRSVMTMAEICKIRDVSLSQKKSASSSPWSTHFGEMAKKTALRRVLKMVQLSPDVQDSLQAAESYEEHGSIPVPPQDSRQEEPPMLAYARHEDPVAEPQQDQVVVEEAIAAPKSPPAPAQEDSFAGSF
ncbi:MAG: recombinase RecT [Magnetococcales bacterium]|nr:recombinase RecT [Magnetococcales bacterium]